MAASVVVDSAGLSALVIVHGQYIHSVHLDETLWVGQKKRKKTLPYHLKIGLSMWYF